ncbi:MULTISPECIES: hypothetical protein [unclassified Microcoleus]|nr:MULTISPECIES: hypothetical protein [unclassified Microcoleus]
MNSLILISPAQGEAFNQLFLVKLSIIDNLCTLPITDRPFLQ